MLRDDNLASDLKLDKTLKMCYNVSNNKKGA